MSSTRGVRPSERAEILEKAADLLETKGWCTGHLWIRNGVDPYSDTGTTPRNADRFCAVGALCAVAPVRTDDVLPDLAAQIQYDYRDPSGARAEYLGVADFNDSQKDKRKVIRLMRRTARNLRNRKGPFTS